MMYPNYHSHLAHPDFVERRDFNHSRSGHWSLASWPIARLTIVAIALLMLGTTKIDASPLQSDSGQSDSAQSESTQTDETQSDDSGPETNQQEQDDQGQSEPIDPASIPDEADLPTTTVGVFGKLSEIKIEGSEIEVVDILDRDSPIFIRIVRSFPHGSARRYEIEYSGREAGVFNLSDYLKRADPNDNEPIIDLYVKVNSVIPEGQIEPHELSPQKTPRLGGYQVLMILLIVFWFIGLGFIIFWGRGKHSAAKLANDSPKTLADKLRPLVTRAIDGSATHEELAQLERNLISFWRRRLELEQAPASVAVKQLREHDAAGGLIKQLEAWLHRPNQVTDISIEELLEPYREIREDAMAEFPIGDSSLISTASRANDGLSTSGKEGD